MILEQDIRSLLRTSTLGGSLSVYDTLPSTNDLAKSIIADAENGTVIVAAHQTAGRGRRGRTFFSPEGCGVYMSVLLKQVFAPEAIGLLTSAVAVAVARAIERLSPVTVQIKWVNDLLIHGKKVCGILAEGTPHGVVIGIGINVSTTDFPADIAHIASSILHECGEAPSRTALVAAVLQELETVLAHLNDGAFLQESRTRSAVIGREVTVLRGEETFQATAVAIDDGGALVVQTENGTQTLFSGEVSLRL